MYFMTTYIRHRGSFTRPSAEHRELYQNRRARIKRDGLLGYPPPLGNAAEPPRPLARFGETPMVGKLAPLPLRLMLRTSQPTGLAAYVFSRVEVQKKV